MVDVISQWTDWEVLFLNDDQIGHFDYGRENADDDCRPLMRHIFDSYEVMVFPTPVYLVFKERRNEGLF